MTDTPYAPTLDDTDLIEYALWQTEVVLLQDGWCRAYERSYDNALLGAHTLDEALQIVVLRLEGDVVTPHKGYESINTAGELLAELRTYIASLLPHLGHQACRPSLAGYNADRDVDLVNILEVLQGAREGWRYENRGYRHRHNRPAQTSFLFESELRNFTGVRI